MGDSTGTIHVTKSTAAGVGPDTLTRWEKGAPPDIPTVFVGGEDFKQGRPSRSLRAVFDRARIPQKGQREIATTFGQVAGRTGFTNDVGGACAFTAPMESGIPIDGKPRDMSTPQGFVEVLLEVPEGTLNGESIPGTKKDILLWTGHHEVDHCRNTHGDYQEYRSDVHANARYAADVAEGYATDRNLPHYIRAMRAAGYMLNNRAADIYATSAISPLAGEKPLTDKELGEAEKGGRNAQQAVYSRIAKDMGLHEDPMVRLEALKNLSDKKFPDGRAFTISDKAREQIEWVLVEKDPQAAKRILNELKIPPAMRDRFSAEVTSSAHTEMMMQIGGTKDTAMRAQLVYETSRKMLAEGAFRTNPHGQAVVQNFVDGAQRYARNLFHVDPAHQPRPLDPAASTQQIAAPQVVSRSLPASALN